MCTFDKVVIQGDGYVSTRALQYLAEANVNVIMLDKQGKLFSHVNQISGSDPLLRQRQYDTFRNEVKVNELRKWIMAERITSQIQLFKELVTEPKFSNKYNKNILKAQTKSHKWYYNFYNVLFHHPSHTQ